MDARLEAIASLVEPGSELIDIGTDHGLLALSLLKRGIVEHISVSDVAEDPLQNARKTLSGRRADFYLADGLPSDRTFDAAIIAGMGGRTMAAILEKDKEAFWRMRYLILQPMQQVKELRGYLLENNFRICRERMVFQGHYYTILQVVPGRDVPYDLDLGKGFCEDREVYLSYLAWQARRIRSFLPFLQGEKRERMEDLLKRIDLRRKTVV